ncbi:MAG: hypothetical protein U9Q03_01255 [Patescibacteria group bacterium]|nr:hypothetical protein [Patescibacteria group bacterium]
MRTIQGSKRGQLLPGATPFVVGALLYGTALVPLMPDALRVPVLAFAFVGAVAITVVMSMVSSAPIRRSVAAWRSALAPTLLVVGAFLFHLLVGSAIGRFTALTFVMLLLVVYFLRADGLDAFDNEGIDALLGFSRLLSAVGLFFLTVFAFGISRFVYMPLIALSLIVGLLYVVVAYESYLQSEAPEKARRLAATVSGVMGLELFIGMSFLPTPFITNAAVCTVAFFAIVLAVNRVLSGTIGMKELRIGLGLAAVLVAVMLGTARWT